MTIGLVPKDCAPISDRFGAVVSTREQVTVAGTTTYNLQPAGFERGFRVIGFRGIMTGAGAASDTVRLAAVDGETGTATNITEAIDLSALSENDWIAAASINITAAKLKQGDYLRITTASDALILCYVELIPSQEIV